MCKQFGGRFFQETPEGRHDSLLELAVARGSDDGVEDRRGDRQDNEYRKHPDDPNETPAPDRFKSASMEARQRKESCERGAQVDPEKLICRKHVEVAEPALMCGELTSRMVVHHQPVAAC